jgi:cytoplasmic iron level regulating protein YaaA (DUF328/UPF0246 family)
MLITLSPAKTLDFDSNSPVQESTTPDFIHESQILIKEAKKLQPDEVSSLMGISERLGVLNWERFQTWEYPFPVGRSKQAAFAFKGDVYTGFEAEKLSAKGLEFAQKHIRILSGLYGVLKPLDQILPYRLEMGTRFENERGKNLYEFWGERLTENLNVELANDPVPVLINLASNEYFKVIKPKKLKARIITPVFKDLKNGQYKIISFYAKKARGLMAAFLCENQILNIEDIKSFETAGYNFNADLSHEDNWIFTRDHS